MEVSVSDAEVRITELVERAEAGEEVILTRSGKAVAKLVPVARPVSPEARRAVLDAVRASGRVAASPGPGAARSQDFLYGNGGLPR